MYAHIQDPLTKGKLQQAAAALWEKVLKALREQSKMSNPCPETLQPAQVALGKGKEKGIMEQTTLPNSS